MPYTCVYDQARLAAILRRQHNVITRQQALDCGMSEKAIVHARRKPGGWQILLPGVYLTLSGETTADQREIAALLYAGPGSVITGAAAVWHYGLPYGDRSMIDVLIPWDVHRKSVKFVRILRTTRMPTRWRTDAGIRFAYLPRAVGDAARGMDDPREVQTLVSVVLQRTACTVAHLIKELNNGPTKGRRHFRAALTEVSAGIRSAVEGDLKRVVNRSGVEKPLYNPTLYLPDGTFLCVPDLWWERYGVAGEVDSLAYHLSAADYENTTKRHNRIESAGIRVLHWIPGTIHREPVLVIRDIRAALAEAARHTPPKIITVPAGQTPPDFCRPPNVGHR